MEYILIFLFLYFVPTACALNRRHNSAGAIAALNIVLGWTVIGWAIALVWALTPNTKPTATNNSSGTNTSGGTSGGSGSVPGSTAGGTAG